MIECTKNFIYYKPKKRKKKSFKRFFSFIIVLVIIVGLYLYYSKVICKQIFNICAEYSYSACTESVNSAVLFSLENKLEYSDLIYVEKNEVGDIVYMSTNSLKINKINRNIAVSSSALIKDKIKGGVSVPFFAFTGINILSGYGNKVKVKIINNVSVFCNFSSKFTSVGINQTLHSIYIDVISQVSMHVPFNNHKAISKTSILISETVLIGKVPDIYLNEGLFN